MKAAKSLLHPLTQPMVAIDVANLREQSGIRPPLANLRWLVQFKCAALVGSGEFPQAQIGIQTPSFVPGRAKVGSQGDGFAERDERVIAATPLPENARPIDMRRRRLQSFEPLLNLAGPNVGFGA